MTVLLVHRWLAASIVHRWSPLVHRWLPASIVHRWSPLVHRWLPASIAHRWSPLVHHWPPLIFVHHWPPVPFVHHRSPFKRVQYCSTSIVDRRLSIVEQKCHLLIILGEFHLSTGNDRFHFSIVDILFIIRLVTLHAFVYRFAGFRQFCAYEFDESPNETKGTEADVKAQCTQK